MNKNRVALGSAIAVLVLALVAIGAFVWGRGDSVDLRSLNDTEFREYADEVVGVDEVIEEYLHSGQIFARFRTIEERYAHDDEQTRWLNEDASDTERNRWFYAEALVLQIIAAKEDMPKEIGPGGELETAHFDAMRACAEDHGWPADVLDDRPWDNPARDEAQTGPRREGYLDLRHECAQWAESYPTLDAIERDSLLALRDEHYRKAIKDFMVANPDIVIPRLDPSECTAEFLPECAPAASR